jgi:ABC-type uncharacterized transport system permease subunit
MSGEAASPEQMRQAINMNMEAFKTLLPGLLETDKGRFALIRNGALVRTFETMAEGAQYANKTYADGLYINVKVAEGTV